MKHPRIVSIIQINTSPLRLRFKRFLILKLEAVTPFLTTIHPSFLWSYRYRFNNERTSLCVSSIAIKRTVAMLQAYPISYRIVA